MSIKDLMDQAVTLKLSVQRITDPSKELFFYSTLDPSIRNQLQDLCECSFELAKKASLFRFKSWPFSSLQELVDSDWKASAIVDEIETQLEKIDSTLEAHKRSQKKPTIPQSTSKPLIAHLTTHSGKEFQMIHARNIPRPQSNFPDKPDNSRTAARTPLPKITLPKANCSCATPEAWTLQHGIHPYEEELNNLIYPDWIFTPEPEQLYLPLVDTPLTVVQDLEQFEIFISKISTQSVIAVDLENHNYRTFQGFSCLMQVSTRSEDFIIDTLACRPFMHRLNAIFSNPCILKVLHGAESDNLWLQRDFGVYLVGLFDTYFASKALGFGAHSLAHLVKHYTGLPLNKAYQLADWRIRPLPQEMLQYAREDTHYLLYIWDCMRNELLAAPAASELMKQVLDRSRGLCTRLYTVEPFGDHTWRAVAAKYNKQLTPVQIKVLKALCDWRDNLARVEDESVHFVMPRLMMMKIVEGKPSRPDEILRAYHPCPPLVKQYVHDILLLVKNQLKEAEQELEKKEQTEKKEDQEIEEKEIIKRPLPTIVPRKGIVALEVSNNPQRTIFDDDDEEEEGEIETPAFFIPQSFEAPKQPPKPKEEQPVKAINKLKGPLVTEVIIPPVKRSKKHKKNSSKSGVDSGITSHIMLKNPVVDLTAAYQSSLASAVQAGPKIKDFDPNAGARGSGAPKSKSFGKRSKASNRSVTFVK